MERVELLARLEQMRGVPVPEDAAHRIYTVRELVEAIRPAGDAPAPESVATADPWQQILRDDRTIPPSGPSWSRSPCSQPRRPAGGAACDSWAVTLHAAPDDDRCSGSHTQRNAPCAHQAHNGVGFSVPASVPKPGPWTINRQPTPTK